MKTGRLNVQPHDIELGRVPMRDASQPMSDAPVHENVDAKDACVTSETSAGRAKKSLLAAVTVGATLLGGTIAAAIAVPTLKQQRNKALAQRDVALNTMHGYEAILNNRSSLDAWVDAQVAADPFWDDVNDSTQGTSSGSTAHRSAAMGYVSCVAPELETFLPENNSGQTPDIGQFAAPGPLFRGGLPRVGDQALALANEPHFHDDGILALQESLVGMRPEFLASNFRVDGLRSNGTRLFAARIFQRNSPLAEPQQAWVAAQARSHAALGRDVAVWPLIAQAGWNAARSLPISALSQGTGDFFDNGMLNRVFAMSVSGSALDAVALNAWAVDSIAPDSTNATAVGEAAGAFADKDDNIPFLVDMLRVNPLVFGTVGFDVNAFALLANATTLRDQTVVRRLNATQLSFEPAGKPAWTVETAGNWSPTFSQYAIVDTHADGLSLRRAVDGPDIGNRFLSYEAMVYAASTLNIGRIHCTDQKLLISQS